MNWSELCFPLDITHLKPFIPHRDQMSWIHQVEWIEDQRGRCRVDLDSSLHLFKDDRCLRRSSAIELIAQSFAYIGLLITLRDSQGPIGPATRMFLAGFKDFWVSDQFATIPQDQKTLLVECELYRALGPLTLVNGRVLSEQEEVLARGQIKVFGE